MLVYAAWKGPIHIEEAMKHKDIVEAVLERRRIPNPVQVLLREIYDGHRDKESPEYNQCDIDQCFWCDMAEEWVATETDQ